MRAADLWRQNIIQLALYGGSLLHDREAARRIVVDEQRFAPQVTREVPWPIGHLNHEVFTAHDDVIVFPRLQLDGPANVESQGCSFLSNLCLVGPQGRESIPVTEAENIEGGALTCSRVRSSPSRFISNH
jgi:hypothetical protein